MNQTENGLFIKGDLYAPLYSRLEVLAKEWGASSPLTLWTNALVAKGMLTSSKHPDRLLPTLFTDLSQPDNVLSKDILLRILLVEEANKNKKSALMRNALHDEMFKNDEKFEYFEEYFSKRNYANEQQQRTSKDLHDFVQEIMRAEDISICHNILTYLSQINRTRNHCFDPEIEMLSQKIVELQKKQNAPLQMNCYFYGDNHFAKGSMPINGDFVAKKSVLYEVDEVNGGIGINNTESPNKTDL